MLPSVFIYYKKGFVKNLHIRIFLLFFFGFFASDSHFVDLWGGGWVKLKGGFSKNTRWNALRNVIENCKNCEECVLCLLIIQSRN